jgi:hypothetical protein
VTSRPIDLARLAIVDLNPVLAVLVRKYPLPVSADAIGHGAVRSRGRACDRIAGAPFDQAPSAEDQPRKEAPLRGRRIARSDSAAADSGHARGIFKAHRALRTPTNASSALAEAQS